MLLKGYETGWNWRCKSFYGHIYRADVDEGDSDETDEETDDKMQGLHSWAKSWCDCRNIHINQKTYMIQQRELGFFQTWLITNIFKLFVTSRQSLESEKLNCEFDRTCQPLVIIMKLKPWLALYSC